MILEAKDGACTEISTQMSVKARCLQIWRMTTNEMINKPFYFPHKPPFFIESIGLTLVCKTRQVLSNKPNKHHLHTASCSHRPKQTLFVSPLPNSTYPDPPFLWLSPHSCLCLCVMYKCFFLVNPFTFFHPVPVPSDIILV